MPRNLRTKYSCANFSNGRPNNRTLVITETDDRVQSIWCAGFHSSALLVEPMEKNRYWKIKFQLSNTNYEHNVSIRNAIKWTEKWLFLFCGCFEVAICYVLTFKIVQNDYLIPIKCLADKSTIFYSLMRWRWKRVLESIEFNLLPFILCNKSILILVVLDFDHIKSSVITFGLVRFAQALFMPTFGWLLYYWYFVHMVGSILKVSEDEADILQRNTNAKTTG